MSFFKRLVVEAHRRSLWQVLGIYLLGAWAGWQVIGEITDRVGLPDWVPAFALILLIIGLPMVLATAFVQEGVPGRQAPLPLYEPTDPTLLQLESAAETADVGARAASSQGRDHFILTWPRAIAAGLVAFLMLGLTAGGYMGMRNAGIGPFGSLVASGKLDNRDRIIIAQFHSTNGDSSLEQAVTEAFRVDFNQTQMVTVVEPSHVRLVLQRMSRDVKSVLDAELARDVAVRDNVKALVTGDISQAGGKYIISARLISAKDGSDLASFRETAADSTQIIDAVDRLSKSLRERLGDSLRDIRAEKPLEAVSTPSLEALLKYTQANVALDTGHDYETGIALLQEALAIDSTFGMAWRKLAVAYSNSGAGPTKTRAAAQKAYDYRDNMTDIERYHATAYYHLIRNETRKAINAYEILLERDPNFVPNNLGLAYRRIREFDKAADAFREAIRRDSTLAVAYGNLANVFRLTNRLPEAEAILKVYARRFPKLPEIKTSESALAMARGDFVKAEALIRELSNTNRNSLLWRANTSFTLADFAQLRGHLGEALKLRQDGARANLERGLAAAPLNRAISSASLSRNVRLDPERAQREMTDALRNHDIEAIPALERPYIGIAWHYADLGDARAAAAWIAKWESAVPPDLRGDPREVRVRLDGLRAVAEQRYLDAIAATRLELDFNECEPCLDYDLAWLFGKAQLPDSAIAYYEKNLAHPGWSIGALAWTRPLAHEQLADLYDQKGDRNKAKLHAAKFVNLWERADPELQPRVQAKRDMLRRLASDGGR